MVRKVYTSEENNLRATLRKVKYNSQPSVNTILRYYEENKDIINSIENVKKYPSQRAILLSFLKKEFSSGDYARIYKLPTDFKINDENIFKSIRLTCSRLTKIIRGNRQFALDDEPWFNKNFSIFVIYILQENARLGNKKKIRPNNKDMNEIAGVYIDKENKFLKTINIPEKLGVLFETLLQNEINVPLFQPNAPENGSWKNISDSLMKKSENIEIEEIGFNLTDLSTGEKIIIKSNKGNVKQYLDAMLNQKIATFFDPEKFDLSYIEYMKVRYKQGHTNFLKFTRNDSGALVIENRSKHKNPQLEKEIANVGMPIGKPIIDTDKISDSKLFQQIIIRGFLSEKESNLSVYKKIMEKLSSYKLIKGIKEVLLYKCYGSIKCWHSSAFRTKICPNCQKSNKTKWWCQGKDVEFNIVEIEKELKRKARKLGIKYRKLKTPFYNKKYELRKLSIPNMPEVNIYFNMKGLYKDLLKDFSLCPRALYCVNFRGEIKEFPEFLCQEDASEFIFRLFDNNKDKLMEFLKKNVLNKSLGEIQENSFKESLEELKTVKKNKELNEKNKGNKYEYLTSNIFNYIFQISDKWGGKNLPDGIIGITSNNEKRFIFWDAKRYDDTKLSKYATKPKKGVVKDIQYVLESVKKEDTYEEGSLKYYLFVTSSTHKDDFKKVQEKIAEIIEKNKYIVVKKKKKMNPNYKRLKEIKFCCINIDELIDLADVFSDKEKRDKLLRSKDFGKAIENILISNDGYIEKNKISSELSAITERIEFAPDKEEHIKKGIDLIE